MAKVKDHQFACLPVILSKKFFFKFHLYFIKNFSTTPVHSNRSSGKRGNGEAIVENGKRRQSLPHESSSPILNAGTAEKLTQQQQQNQQNGKYSSVATTQRDEIVIQFLINIQLFYCFSTESQKKNVKGMKGGKKVRQPKHCRPS